MDSDIDIPDPDELEWLESNALDHREEEDDGNEGEFIAPEDEGEFEGGPASASVNPPASRKRPCSEEEGVSDASGRPLLHEEERSTRRRVSEVEDDENWLRYSPRNGVPADDVPLGDHQTLSPPIEKFFSRFASDIEGDCMPVTGPCGDRIYIKLNAVDVDIAGGKSSFCRQKPSNILLSEPIDVLMQKAEQQSLDKAMQESFGCQHYETSSTRHTASEPLWVEKYAPRSFKELLSDEQTNREVLLWLKQWDPFVFGSQIVATTDDVLFALKQHSSITQYQVLSGHCKFNRDKKVPFLNQNHKHANILVREANSRGVSDAWNRKSTTKQSLEHKVLLLCGPPGLGKTTLAHVAAKHCGYHVVEINASDDRSSSIIGSKILDVIQMNSVMADSKPKCLVIDEIDGALGEGKGAVEVILKMLNAERKSNSEKWSSAQGTQPEKASLKKGPKTVTLSRPVICICNDLYAPALRQLRQVAKVHVFVQPTVSRVVNRLKYICNRERFKTSSIALSALVEYTECDIRSCLNTLQFLNKKKQDLNVLDVGCQVVGHKDMSKSTYDVWKEVFQKRKARRERNSTNNLSRFDFLYSIISNCGDYELTMDGIHENLLHLSYHDPKMQKTSWCLDTLSVSDLLRRYILRTQQMSLQAYQPPFAIAVSYLIAQVDKPNIEWPKSLQRCRTVLMERKELLKSWHMKIIPPISRHLSIESFVEDVVSPFLHILYPPALRPVALHLLSEREKDDLAQLVDTMVSYSLTYKNSKSEPLKKLYSYGAASDVPVLSLDPPINDFVNFKDYQSLHCGLSAAMKQFLLHEVDKQKILLEGIGKSKSPTNKSSTENQASHISNAEMMPISSITTAVSVEDSCKDEVLSRRQIITCTNSESGSEHNKRMPAASKNPKAPGISKRPCSNLSSFFDRFIKEKNGDSKQSGGIAVNTATTERDSRPFLFKYNEGFTNAVKRPVKVRELLLYQKI